MNSDQTQEFARRLMREVWELFDADAVERFYHKDVVGHHRRQRLSYNDIIHRLVTDGPRYPDSKFDIRDIVAAEDKWAIRFHFTASGAQGPIFVEANYFYHLRDGKVDEFWLLADHDFDYKAED